MWYFLGSANKAIFLASGRAGTGGGNCVPFQTPEYQGKGETLAQDKKRQSRNFCQSAPGAGRLMSWAWCTVSTVAAARAALSSEHRGPPESHPGRCRSWAGTTFRGQFRSDSGLSGPARQGERHPHPAMSSARGREEGRGWCAQKREEGGEGGQIKSGRDSFFMEMEETVRSE